MLSTLQHKKEPLWCDYGSTYHTVLSDKKIKILCQGYIRKSEKVMEINIPKVLLQYFYNYIS